MAYGNQDHRLGDDDELLNAEYLDALRATLAAVLMQDGDLGVDDVYSLVFLDGHRIIWH